MTLDLIVPHYKEPWEVCRYLFDSIALQRGICFDNIKVIVVNDGDCGMFDENLDQIRTQSLLNTMYPYKISYLPKEHGGVSAARNYGLDHSEADYVMFCDIDDGFLNNYGLHLVFAAMQEKHDYIYSNFVEETFTADNTMTIIRHDNDFTFMHGKGYKRSFLVERNIRFDPAMTLHEDGYFNSVVLAEVRHLASMKCIETPFYLWRWNDASTVRKDREDFVLRTYENVMQTRIGTCEQIRNRGYEDDFKAAVCMTVLNSYYDFQKPSYHIDKNKEHLRKAEKAFKRFWSKFGKVFLNCTNIEVAEFAKAARENACKNGMLMERQDLRSWLKHIGNEVM